MEKEVLKFKVAPEEHKQRLDKFLVNKLPNYTRSQIQKIIKAGHVTVNDKKVTVHHFLKTNDLITAALKEEKKPLIKELPEPKIIFEDENFLVLDKPSGLIVHPTEKVKSGTLVDFLLKHFPAIKGVGEDPNRPGIVHRLDKDASGLMVIAKNQNAFAHLKKQFQNREIFKEYTALLFGSLPKDSGTITFPIGRSKTNRRLMAARPLKEAGREALTNYQVIQRFKNYTLVKAIIKTGRPHQIRVHFKSIGHGVVGDPIYKTRGLKIKKEYPRIFLHSSKIVFKDFNNQPKEFNSPLPQELQNFLKIIS